MESPRAAAIIDAEIDPVVMTEWQTARRNLKLVRIALALADAAVVVGADLSLRGPTRDVGFATSGTDEWTRYTTTRIPLLCQLTDRLHLRFSH